MSVRKEQLRALKPYLIGEEPRDNGEWDMFCPLHEDSKRSASLNVQTGDWWCFAGCGGGKVSSLIRRRAEWVDPNVAATNGHAHTKPKRHVEPETITEAMISGWHSALKDNYDSSMDWLNDRRGITTDTIMRHEVGWDRSRQVYTLPVRDPDGAIVNVRRYDPRPSGERRKIYNVDGMGSPPRMYPGLPGDDDDPVIVCEGEWDALRTIQEGYCAVTRTAAARVWNSDWSPYFKDKVVYLCHDADVTGQSANRVVGRALRRVAKEVYVVHLPYPIEEKHGKDLSDFWEDYDRDHFDRLLREAEPFTNKVDDQEPEYISVAESFDSRRVSKPTKMLVTIKGKKEQGYSVPRAAQLTCTIDEGAKCNYCPLKGAMGEAKHEIKPTDPHVLEMLDSTNAQLIDIVRRSYGAPKCKKLNIELTDHQAVEILFARPSLDQSSGHAADYKNVKVTNVGKHNTVSNTTQEVIGALYPNPRTQANEFLAWEMNAVQTAVDHFELTPEAVRLMKRFQVRTGQRPLRKLGQISRELSSHVTKIYGRPEMHALMDLVWHSALSFRFRDEEVHRGWVEALVLGDTRTGKSEAASRLARHYGSGEVVGGESSTLAGLVGGLQQYGVSKEWAVTWGAIPLNDRRLVVIDEASGLSRDDIGKMSDVRASGIARLTKIQSEITYARTRLLWLSNPRDAKMEDFTFGVQALRPLVGANEDIARFDLLCCVSLHDVPAVEMNRPHDAGTLTYTAEACSTLVRWVWTRTEDQIVWQPGAEHAVYQAALDLGERYTEDPPLLQAANARIKVARVAVALAARLFSTDDTHENIVVTREHVADAVAFIDRLYSMPTCGYAERSAEEIKDRREAADNSQTVRKYLKGRKGLPKFLRGTSSFRRQDLEEVLNMSREEANAVINTLWDARMIRKDGPDIRIEPPLHSLLREVR